MEVSPTAIPDVLLLSPQRFEDQRGWFMESWSKRRFREAAGDWSFVQDNHSYSSAGVLRGVHYQLPPSGQGKLVRVVRGAVKDVAVDLRRSSGTFGAWVMQELSAENQLQMWIPPGFGHGFLALTEVELLYKVTAPYDPTAERTIRWDDPDLAIEWGIETPGLNGRDASAPRLRDAELPG